MGVLLFGVAAVGCGGDDNGSGNESENQAASTKSDESAIRDLSRKISRDMKAGNAQGFCELFEPGQLNEWVGKEQCVKLFAAALKNAPKNIKYEVKDITVDGDTGTVDLGFGETSLQKVDGQWYLETPDTDPAPETSGE